MMKLSLSWIRMYSEQYKWFTMFWRLKPPFCNNHAENTLHFFFFFFFFFHLLSVVILPRVEIRLTISSLLIFSYTCTRSNFNWEIPGLGRMGGIRGVCRNKPGQRLSSIRLDIRCSKEEEDKKKNVRERYFKIIKSVETFGTMGE